MMTDKNGKTLKTGDIVSVTGGYFATDNDMFKVEHSPGDFNWTGSDYCLYRLNKSGKVCNDGKHKTAFWPLMVTVNGHDKRTAAREHNANNAQIEIVDATPTAQQPPAMLDKLLGYEEEDRTAAEEAAPVQ